jgi:RHS repeat-associated protein
MMFTQSVRDRLDFSLHNSDLARHGRSFIRSSYQSPDRLRRSSVSCLRLAIYVAMVMAEILLPLCHAGTKYIIVTQPDTPAFGAYTANGCQSAGAVSGSVTIQPKHGSVSIQGATFTNPACPGVSFPGQEAYYTASGTLGTPGSGSDAFHVHYTSPQGNADEDVFVSIEMAGKDVGANGPPAPTVPSVSGSCPGSTPANPCNPRDASRTVSSVGRVSAGEPIDAGTGNVYYAVTDYTTAGANPLSFTRYYNSGASYTGFAIATGFNWRHNYDRYLDLLNANVIAVERPDGQVLDFFNNGSAWVSDTDVDYKLSQSGDTWTLTCPDDTVETYTQIILGTLVAEEAELTQIKARNGYTQTLTYNGMNQLAKVTDSYNRTLTFTYSNGLLSEMTTPENNTFTYNYNANKTLSYMASPIDQKGATYNYFYENTSLPMALTGVADKYGERLATWTYDSQGRGLTSSQGGSNLNANLTTLTYETNTTTITNALGVTDTYTFMTLQGVPKIVQISRAATSTTPAATRSFAYDGNGYLASQTDWNGNTTSYVNNTHGLPTAVSEVAGTSVARTVTVAYDPTWVHLPDTVTTSGETISYTYDPLGELLSQKLADTTTTSSPYSTNGQTRTWTFTYANSLLATAKTPNGQTTSYTYTNGSLTKITNPLNQSITVTSHTTGGYPETIVDANGVTDTVSYDAQMRPIRSVLNTAGGQLTTTYNWWFAGFMSSFIRPDGTVWNMIPDAAMRLSNGGDGANVYKLTLDKLGDRTSIGFYDPNNNLSWQHSATFDALGRMLTDVAGAGQTTTYTYDNNANPLTVKDGLSHTTTNVFDPLNRLSTSTDANSGVVAITYDAHDRPLTVRDKNGNTTSYVYDGFGDVIEQVSPDSGTTVYHYDGDGNLTSKTDAATVVTNWTYDALDRPLTTTYPADSAENIAYAYDQPAHGFGVGRLTSVTDAAGSLSRTYDERGNVLTSKRTNGSSVLTTTYTYDKASRVASITHPSGAAVSYTRDGVGNISAMPFTATGNDGQGTIIYSAAHLPFGPVSSLGYDNGDLASFTYDKDYRLTILNYATYQSVPYVKWTYGYDAANNVRTIADNITSANSQTLGYDVLNRLTSASSTGTYGNLSYVYDKNGNLSSRAIGGVTYTQNYTSGTNRLSSITWPGNTQAFGYTPTGNINSITVNGGNSYTLGYNKANRLMTASGGSVSLAVTGETYDYAGKRITKSNNGSPAALYTYDLDGDLIEENESGTVTDYLYMDGLNVGIWQPGQPHLYMVNFDSRGVAQVSRDKYGLTNWAAYSTSYGQMSQTVATGQFTGPVTQNNRLPGQYYDHETGFHYNGFRDYLPSVGRYLEPDPVGLGGGLNTYAYVGGNPWIYTDRTGQFFGADDAGEFWIAIFLLSELHLIGSYNQQTYFSYPQSAEDQGIPYDQFMQQHPEFNLNSDNIPDYDNSYPDGTGYGQCTQSNPFGLGIGNGPTPAEPMPSEPPDLPDVLLPRELPEAPKVPTPPRTPAPPFMQPQWR